MKLSPRAYPVDVAEDEVAMMVMKVTDAMVLEEVQMMIEAVMELDMEVAEDMVVRYLHSYSFLIFVSSQLMHLLYYFILDWYTFRIWRWWSWRI